MVYPWLMNGDCLEKMKEISDASVDMILADLPYGTTMCKWDIVIPFDPLWKEFWRMVKTNGVIAIFGCEPFSSYLRMSQIQYFKYDWIWYKNTATGIAQAKYQPMRNHETISIFYRKKPNFYPIKKRTESEHIATCAKRGLKRNITSETEHNSLGGVYGGDFQEYVNPRTVLKFNGVNNRDYSKKHPVQKPIDLLAYLIKSYTQEGERILDPVMGSGSTGIACINTQRNFIGIEKDPKYFEIAKNWIEYAYPKF